MRIQMVHYYEEEYGDFSKPELAHDPAISPLGIYLKKTKTLIWKDICTHMFTEALFTIAKYGNISEVSKLTDKKKSMHIYLHI